MSEETIALERIEPNKYNPNVLKGEKFEALKRDMMAGSYDPILVSSKTIFYGDMSSSKDARYVIVDGEWRWRAATELGLKALKCVVRDIPLARAKILTYKKNRERGNMDPLKEAELFDAEVKSGLNEKKVAARYGVDRSYVAGRRLLLKVTPVAVELFRNPSKLKERFEHEVRKDVAEQRAQPENAEVTDEEAEAHIQEQLAEFVPRGTPTPGHLKAIATLPAEQQNKLIEDIIQQDLTVRDVEDRAKRIHERLETEKRFKEALAKARQKTCPYCGAEPQGFNYNNELRFSCSKCYNSWDFMVTKAELKKQETESKTAIQVDRGEQIKKRIKNPAYIRRKETIEELTGKIRDWVLRKVQQLTVIDSVDITGSRKDGEKIHIDFPGYGHALEFNMGEKSENEYYNTWKQKLSFSMEKKDYKTVDAKTKIDLYGATINAERRVEVHRFFDEIVKTDADPFLPEDKKLIRTLLEQYGEENLSSD